ncbi:hypothetical protein ABZ044_32450, partial [Streptomyces werraensis]
AIEEPVNAIVDAVTSPGVEPGEADLVVPDEDGFTVRTVPVLRLTPARALRVLLHARRTTSTAPATAAPPASAAPATTAAAAPATATTAPTWPPAPATTATATATAEPSATAAPLTATTSAPATTAPASTLSETLADLTGPADDDELR